MQVAFYLALSFLPFISDRMITKRYTLDNTLTKFHCFVDLHCSRCFCELYTNLLYLAPMVHV